MWIRKMDDADLDSISRIDFRAFGHEKSRSIENLKALKLSDPEGCFVLEDKNVIIGYSFSKTMGSEGYLGPIGITPEYQNSGYGKTLILKNIEYLKSKCNIIGLEVLPELGENIGLYHKMGFISGFPSLRFEFPSKIKKINLNYDYLDLSKVSRSIQIKIIDKIDLLTKKYFNGVSYKKDIIDTLKFKGVVLVAFENEEPLGFIAYSKTLLPHLWGCIKPHNDQKYVLKEIIAEFSKINNDNNIIIEVNARYDVLIKQLTKMDFKVSRSVNRMFLKDYEGDYLKKSKKFSFRCWIG